MTDSSSTSDPGATGWLAARLRGRLARAAGLVTLAASLALMLLAGDGPLLRLRAFGADEIQRRLPRQPTGHPVVIVAIDDASLARLGQWPWPRHLVAELIQRIHQGRPKALGIDILWPEPDRLSPARWVTLERGLPPDLAARVAALPDHDASLAAAIAAGPTVLGVAGLREGHHAAGRLAPVLSRGADVAPFLPEHAVMLRSLPEIDGAAQGHGLLSADTEHDGTRRRVPMLSRVAGSLVPSLSLEMLRVATGADRIDAYADAGGVIGIDVGGLPLATERDGAIRLAFAPADDGRQVSAADLLEERLPADLLEDRLVLLGVTGLGLLDRVMTPLGERPGVELHAQLLEGVIADRLAARPRWAPWAEAGLLAAVGLALVLLLPGRRAHWYGPAALLGLGLFAGAAIGAWQARLWVIDGVLPALGTGAVMVALVGGGLADSDAQRRRLRRELEAERLSAARLAGEIEAARRIQMGILPRPQSLVRDGRFDLDALLEPAKEIGGDLYDFFPVDRRHLFVAIGDVTGKGVPASLFMALGKALYKSCALRGSLDPAAIMTTANHEISRDNPEMLFITLFAGLLDLETGTLVYCNAGHEPPYAVMPGTPPRILRGESGPPLCVLEDYPYVAETVQLRPGELLCLVTDGITEAMDAAGSLMGHQPVLDCLAALPPDADAAGALAALRQTVRRFVGEADPSDDLTAVMLRWTGPAAAGRPATQAAAATP